MRRSSIDCPNQIACSVDQAAVRIEAKAVPWQRRGDRAVALELVLRREHAALQLVAREAVAGLERLRERHELVDAAHLALAVLRARVTEEEIRRERHAVAQPPAEDLRDRHAPLLAQDVEARELERREQLRPVVVERSGRVGDPVAHLLEPCRIVPEQVALQSLERGGGTLAAPAHLAEARQPLVGLDLDDRAHEAAPVAAVRVAQRRLERDADGCRLDRGDLHVRTDCTSTATAR